MAWRSTLRESEISLERVEENGHRNLRPPGFFEGILPIFLSEVVLLVP